MHGGGGGGVHGGGGGGGGVCVRVRSSFLTSGHQTLCKALLDQHGVEL